jgi:hypothetical protein
MTSLPLPSARVRAAHLFALCAFGLAQPTLAILSNQPNYLATEGFHGIDVVLFSLAILLVPPAVLMALELAVGLLHPRATAVLHGFFVGLGVVVVVFRALSSVPANFAAIAALAAGLMAARLYRTWPPARLFVTMAALASVLFLAFFLFTAPLEELSTTDVHAGVMPKVTARTPVVLLIFDEFPTTSLMTESNRIDSDRYPNFAALAETSTWYRSATTVHDFTEWNVPAILTGQRPRHEDLPVLADHPKNLFTLLGSGYRINAFEAMTRLCPVSLCPNAKTSFDTRMRRLGTHLERFFMTTKLLTDIPAWSDPPAQVSAFLASLRPSSRPELYVLHVILPHQPWRYLPSGRTYQAWSSNVRDKWEPDNRLVDQVYEQHLLQVGYVDRVLGRIVKRLRSTGLWNRSLVIVTADEGMSFLPGEHERQVDLTNISDIAPVPLFVKKPEQQQEAIDDRSALTIDIVPTIADLLGVRVPWKLDGRSLLARNRPFPSKIIIGSRTGGTVEAPWAHVRAGLEATIARKIRLFGSGNESLFASARHRGLLGAEVNTLIALQTQGIRARIVQPSSTSFDPRSSYAPSRVSGTVTGLPTGRVLDLAIAVNGRIATITRTFREGGVTRFSTFVPDSAFRAGVNNIAVLAIRDGMEGRLALALIGLRSGGGFALASNGTKD